MPSKPGRIDTSSPRENLGVNPFAALAGLAAAAPSAPAPAPAAAASPAPAWRVKKTSKGGWPVRMEKRPGGKVATIVERIEGDAQALCNALKKKLATGGAVKEGCIELQGDHVKNVTAFLQGG